MPPCTNKVNNLQEILLLVANVIMLIFIEQESQIVPLAAADVSGVILFPSQTVSPVVALPPHTSEVGLLFLARHTA